MALALLCTTARAALVSSYDFNGDYTDSLGNGNDLSLYNVGLLTGGRYVFGNNQGLRLTDAVSNSNEFAIEMKLQREASGLGWSKIIDFSTRLSDFGLYFYGQPFQLGFKSATGGPVGPIVTPGQDVVIGLYRSGATMQLFLDGALVFSGSHNGDIDVGFGANTISFFVDDIASPSPGTESFGGSVDWIRIHDDPTSFQGATTTTPSVPEPGTFVTLALGLIGVARRRGRVRRAGE